jgi:zinc/manganese transport system substrate-binding protein
VKLSALCAAALLAALPTPAARAVTVVASTNDLASIAASVGGDRVQVAAIARPNADVHRVELLPSYMVRVSRAQLYLKVGLGLDLWADGIIAGSRNARLQVADCSQGVRILERPTGRVDASMGDVHPHGNPHYWLDPANGAVVGRTVAEALAAVDPAHAGEYRARAEAFAREAEAARAHGRQAAAALPARSLLTYHRSWSYFADAFGLEVAATVEPFPGIPPTAKHLAGLVELVRGRGVKVLVQEPYFSAEAGKFLAREAGVRVLVRSASCDRPEAGRYLAHIEGVLRDLSAGAPGKAAQP